MNDGTPKDANLVDQGDSGAWVRMACSRVIEMNLFTGACMPLGFHPAFVDRQEQIVTVLAASTAILVVAAIAVLMGMA